MRGIVVKNGIPVHQIREKFHGLLRYQTEGHDTLAAAFYQESDGNSRLIVFPKVGEAKPRVLEVIPPASVEEPKSVESKKKGRK